jgi:cation transport regulator ChaC
MNKTYIFGYGSLMNYSSIKKTIFDNTKYNITLPDSAEDFDDSIQIVQVKNIKRGWYYYVGSPTTKLKEPWTALGAYTCDNYTCNGVLFPVTKEQIKLLDLREFYYTRKKINKKDITVLKGTGIPRNSIVYFYSLDSSKLKTPCPEYPIPQSYVDLCMKGSIKIDKLLGNKNYEFTREFVKTTYDWKKNKCWLANRDPKQNNKYFDIIDQIIYEYI